MLTIELTPRISGEPFVFSLAAAGADNIIASISCLLDVILSPDADVYGAMCLKDTAGKTHVTLALSGLSARAIRDSLADLEGGILDAVV